MDSASQDEKHIEIEHREVKATGNALLVSRDGEVRRLPIPSSNPNDPLNFTKWEKFGVILSCCWFCMLQVLPLQFHLTN